jgi:STIP1 family protein 1
LNQPVLIQVIKPSLIMPNCSATDLKNEGNALFSARKYRDAIVCYSKAIVRDPSVSTFYTNRALCYLKLRQWDIACQDCHRAIDNDPHSIKAHFFLGQALYELDLHDEAIASLLRALDLSKDQRQNFGDDITGMLRMAKKKKWCSEEEKRIAQEVQLQTHLNNLLLEDKNRQIESVTSLSETEGNDSSLSPEIEVIENDYANKLKQVSALFAKLDDRRKKRDVPDVMCSRISFGIMRDPVITPSGITYERKDIMEHLQRLGHFDPVTRKELNQEQLVPNLALKEVIDTFLQENAWAEDY